MMYGLLFTTVRIIPSLHYGRGKEGAPPHRTVQRTGKDPLGPPNNEGRDESTKT